MSALDLAAPGGEYFMVAHSDLNSTWSLSQPLIFSHPSLPLIRVSSLGLVAVAVSLIAICWYVNQSCIQRTKRRFKGPRQFPVVGRIHDLPEKYIWLKFTEWANQYGPIYYTSMLGARLIVVSDTSIARELLVKRASKYSGRPQIPALVPHTETSDYLPLMGRTKHWSGQRKFAHAALAASSRHDYHGVMDCETKRVVAMILLDPDQVQAHLEDQASRIICTLSWGEPSQSRINSRTALAMLQQMSPAGTVANRLTPLNSLPMSLNHWVKHEDKRYKDQTEWWLSVYEDAKSRFRQDKLSPNTWAHRYLSQLKRDSGTLDQSGEDTQKSANALGMFTLLGVYTVMPQVCFLIMAFVEHPEWLRKCQEEIDHVCGARSPDLQDYDKLFTLRACIKETLRWRPNVPLGVPHEAEEDDVYDGVHIKKGTVVLALQWNIARQPGQYPDPESWRPERWLDPEWPTYKPDLHKNLQIQDTAAFGWGKRNCVGGQYSQDMLFLTGSMLAYAFDLRHKLDLRTGEKIPLDTMASNSYVILNPDPFEISIKARSKERAAEIIRSLEEAIL